MMLSVSRFCTVSGRFYRVEFCYNYEAGKKNEICKLGCDIITITEVNTKLIYLVIDGNEKTLFFSFESFFIFITIIIASSHGDNHV